MILENIDHNLAYYEIPAQLACAYLKGHLKGRALDWFEVQVIESLKIRQQIRCAMGCANLSCNSPYASPVVLTRKNNGLPLQILPRHIVSRLSETVPITKYPFLISDTGY
ncbi:hypothetical protein TNCV_2271851 [Trichonephila clavipes]|nr:hypothetical protein TNCV_2271851 [Trichonephila clavipes]